MEEDNSDRTESEGDTRKYAHHNPHIVVPDAARAAEWYVDALGAEERNRIPVPGGKLMSVELWFGDSAVMVADEFPEMGVLSPQSVGGTSTVLNLYVEDVDALWERAMGAGAEVLHPLGDTFWGDRHGQITEPFGHRWGLAQHVRDVPTEEVVRAAAEAFGRPRTARFMGSSWAKPPRSAACPLRMSLPRAR
jgi:PhnB protein